MPDRTGNTQDAWLDPDWHLFALQQDVVAPRLLSSKLA
jgi:hypothetical protein